MGTPFIGEARIRVLIASDIRLYCEGLASLLHPAETFQLLGGVSGAMETLEHIRTLTPDVLLLDMAMDDAFAIARHVPRVSKTTRIVALGMPESEADIIACAQIGIAGYVSRSSSVNDALEAVQAAARGELRCSPKIAGFLFRHIAALSGARQSPDPIAGLTARESQILRLLQQGFSNKMISRQLGIEPPTVKNHLHALFGKLGVHRRAEAVSLLHRKSQRDGVPVPPELAK